MAPTNRDNNPIEKSQVDLPKSPSGCFHHRYLVTVMSAFGLAINFIHRVDISVAIVAMVNQSFAISEDKNYSTECTAEFGNTTTGNTSTTGGTLNWDKETQGLVLASFFIGYLLLQIPAGYIASRFSAKWTFAVPLLTTGLLGAVIPVSTETGIWAIMTIRALQGLAQGFVFPAMIALSAKWHPPQEMGILSSVNTVGANGGLLIGLSVSGLLAEYGFAGGWPSIFYVFAIATVVWFVVWCLLVYDSPDLHPRISNEEKDFIIKTIGLKLSNDKSTIKTPWLKMLLSRPVWAHIILMFCVDFIFFTWITCIPQYMNDVLRFDVSTNGLISALPTLLSIFISPFAAKLGDVLIKRKILSTTVTKKVFVAATIIPLATFLILLRYVGCDRILTLVFLNFAICFVGFITYVIFTNPLDLTRHHAGIMFGFSNTAGAIAGFSGPYVVGLITNENPTRDGWMIIFYIAVGVGVLGMIMYILLGSGERQDWDIEDEELEGEKYKETIPSEGNDEEGVDEAGNDEAGIDNLTLELNDEAT